eukprot:scaffold22279_cov123-Isochrysis_galbana.AAC.3
MDSLKRVYNKNKSSSDVKRTIRELKNKVYNYSEMEQMVREATCNDATEPKVTLMREVAKGTFTVEFTSIMGIIWKRIREEKNERHPFKWVRTHGAAAPGPSSAILLDEPRPTRHPQVPHLAGVSATRGQRRDGARPDPEQPSLNLGAHQLPPHQRPAHRRRHAGARARRPLPPVPAR